MAFDKKTWANNQAGGTPLDASGLNDLESRIADGIKNPPLVEGVLSMSAGFTSEAKLFRLGNIVFFFGTLRGTIAANEGEAVATIPSGFRPDDRVRTSCANETNRPSSMIDVEPTGTVTLYNRDSTSRAWFGFSLVWVME